MAAGTSKLEKKVDKISKGEIAIQSKSKGKKKRPGKKEPSDSDDARSADHSASQLSVQTKSRLTKVTAKTRSKAYRMSSNDKSNKRSATVEPKAADNTKLKRKTSILNDVSHLDNHKMPTD